jgi:hypothetical protein
VRVGPKDIGDGPFELNFFRRVERRSAVMRGRDERQERDGEERRNATQVTRLVHGANLHSLVRRC